MTTREKAGTLDEAIDEVGAAMAHAWQRYTQLFGQVPHGSCRQLAAVLRLCPEAREAIGLWNEAKKEANRG